MTRTAWTSDVHFDFLSEHQIIEFARGIASANPEIVLLSGDISVARDLVLHLSMLESVIKRPIYFVLGNHDYYGSNVETMQKKMHELTNMSEHLKYLKTLPYVQLGSTAVVGADGWYDAGYGNGPKSRFVMADWHRIGDFAALESREKIISVAQKLSHASVTHVYNSIKAAVRYCQHIVVVTHVPPYPETHFYQGKIGDADAQPWFTSRMMGDMLLDASKAFPQHKFTVLAGHTHGKFSGQIKDNLVVHVNGWDPGVKDYGNPIFNVIDL